MSRLCVRCVVVLSSFLIVLATIGCGAGGVANLRVVNGAVNEPQVNVILDNTTISSNLAYPATTGYISVSAGSRNLVIEPVNSTTDIVNSTLTLGGSTNTTVIAAGITAPFNPIVLTDETTTPTSGTADIRLVNAAPNLGSTDVYVVPDGTGITGVSPLVSGVTFGTAPSTYQNLTITAGTSANYDVYFTDPGTKLALLATGPISITSGSATTLVILDVYPVGSGFTFLNLQDLQ